MGSAINRPKSKSAFPIEPEGRVIHLGHRENAFVIKHPFIKMLEAPARVSDEKIQSMVRKSAARQILNENEVAHG